MSERSVFRSREEWVEAADGGRFLLTWVEPARIAHRPLVFLPGMFSERSFWLSARGVGLAAYLAEAGFPGVIVQRREADGGARPGLEEHLRYDLPLVQRRLAAVWGESAFWIGHSFGGMLCARATAETLDPRQVAGLVLFAAQFELGKRPLHPPGSWGTRLLTALYGRFPARRLGLGPRDEPPAAMDDAIRLVVEGRRRPQLREALRRIEAPTLAISGAGDKGDPSEGCRRLIDHFVSTDKRFVLAGRSQGYAVDYDHAGIVVSKEARQEIWPLVRDWLLAHDR